jgi:hypothetical protein
LSANAESGESLIIPYLLNDSQHTSAALTVNENYDRGAFNEKRSMPVLIFLFTLQDVRKGTVPVFNDME